MEVCFLTFLTWSTQYLTAARLLTHLSNKSSDSYRHDQGMVHRHTNISYYVSAQLSLQQASLFTTTPKLYKPTLQSDHLTIAMTVRKLTFAMTGILRKQVLSTASIFLKELFSPSNALYMACSAWYTVAITLHLQMLWSLVIILLTILP